MAMDIDTILEWLQEVKAAGVADSLAIDDGGLQLVALKDGHERCGAYVELGGIPLPWEVEDNEIYQMCRKAPSLQGGDIRHGPTYRGVF